MLIVSHDRHLLDECVGEIAELDRGRVRIWPGAYSAYTVARRLELERQRQRYVTQQKEIARLEEAIRRFRHWAHIRVDERHIRQARVKQMQIDRMEKVERPVLERRKMALALRSGVRGGQRVLALESVDVAFGDDPVLLDVELVVDARRARRRRRPQRRRQDGAGAGAGRRPRAERRRPLGRPGHRGRLPLAGRRRAAGGRGRASTRCAPAARCPRTRPCGG